MTDTTTPIIPTPTTTIYDIGTVTNATYTSADDTEIHCIVTFPNNPAIPSTGIPFNARADDVEVHGQQLFADLIAGKYGDIAAYMAPPLTLDQQYAAAISNGVVVTSASTAALNGTYGVSPDDQANISSEAQFISTFQEFTTDAETIDWADITGAVHTFPSTAVFMAFAKATAQYVSACKQTMIALANGGTATFPSNVISIS